MEYNGSYTIDTQLAKWDDIQEIYGAGYNGELPTSSTSGTNSSWGPKADDFMFKYFDGEERPSQLIPVRRVCVSLLRICATRISCLTPT
ncbi:Uncharacterised protein [Segatella copri]|nr:Uncharacterised protein [Segatella copri]